MEVAKDKGVPLDLTVRLRDDNEIGEDRELIKDFLVQASEVQSWLTICEQNNAKMKKQAETQIYENKSANQEIRTDILNKLIDANADYFKRIKANLALMKIDIEESKESKPDEPETRVKKTVHHTFTQKFRDVLRTS